MVLPLWARALRVADRYAWYAYHAHEIVRDEVLLACLAPELRAELTVLAYSELSTYLPGGSTFEAGLFEWERAMMACAALPRTGRVLLAAAGGGRELKALREAGYEVTAFEPNPRLYAGAESVARQLGNVQLLRGRYEDLSAAACAKGPLAALSRTQFDWVLFGWGSFTHITQSGEQLAILEAVRALARGAPLALSFFTRRADPSLAVSRSDRLRAFVRRFTRADPERPRAAPDGAIGYEYGGGFVYRFTRAEFAALAARAGYELVVWDESAFPYAVLVPRTK